MLHTHGLGSDRTMDHTWGSLRKWVAVDRFRGGFLHRWEIRRRLERAEDNLLHRGDERDDDVQNDRGLSC